MSRYSLANDACTKVRCGLYAECHVDGQNKAVCMCPGRLVGNPLVACLKSEACTTNADCMEHSICNGTWCTCIHGYTGEPNCRPNCTKDSCEDPCSGNCAVNAVCKIVDHVADCTCPAWHTGNPYTNCTPTGKHTILENGMYQFEPRIMLCFQRNLEQLENRRGNSYLSSNALGIGICHVARNTSLCINV